MGLIDFIIMMNLQAAEEPAPEDSFWESDNQNWEDDNTNWED